MAHIGHRGRRLLKKALSPSRACASVEELAGLSDGSLPAAASAHVRNHLTGCPRCRTELAMMQEFQSAVARPDEQEAVSWISSRLERRFAEDRAASPARSWWHGWFTFRSLNLAGAALGMAALIGGIAVALRERSAPELSAPSDAAPVFRSGELIALGPAGDLDQAPVELRWEAAASGASYSVRLMEVDRTEVWSAETRQPSATLPAAVRALIVPGKPLLWDVAAKDRAGRPVASSGMQRFRVRRESTE